MNMPGDGIFNVSKCICCYRKKRTNKKLKQKLKQNIKHSIKAK